MSDSDSDTQVSVQMPAEASKPEKKPRKKTVVTEQKRAASQANIIKAREARAKKKEARLQAESEHQQILNELVAEKKKSKSQPIGKPEKPPTKTLSSSESESEASEESESETDEEVEYVLTPAKKKAPKSKKSYFKAEVEALKAQIAALQQKKPKAPKPAPLNVYFGRQPAERKMSALDQKVLWE